MIGMGMGNQGRLNGPPWVNIKVASFAVQPFWPHGDQRHAKSEFR